MPFSLNVHDSIGSIFRLIPYHGYGWHCNIAPGVESVFCEIPGELYIKAEQVIVDNEVARALVGVLTKTDTMPVPLWVCAIPRSDSEINIFERSVGCNVLFSGSQPRLSAEHLYPHPSHIESYTYPQLRGFAKLHYHTGV